MQAKYIEYTKEELNDLKQAVYGIEVLNNSYVPFIKMLKDCKSSHEIYLSLLSYLSKYPGDNYILASFQSMYHEDISNLPLYINRSEIIGAIAKWRLGVGK